MSDPRDTVDWFFPCGCSADWELRGRHHPDCQNQIGHEVLEALEDAFWLVSKGRT